jgi:hypothetical protein
MLQSAVVLATQFIKRVLGTSSIYVGETYGQISINVDS